MATIDNWDLVAQIMAGMYADDHPKNVVAYRNAWGMQTYGVALGRDREDKYLHETLYVQQPVEIWNFALDGYCASVAAAKELKVKRLGHARES